MPDMLDDDWVSPVRIDPEDPRDQTVDQFFVFLVSVGKDADVVDGE